MEEKNRAFGGAIRKNRAAWKVSRATPLFHIYMLKVLIALHEDRSVMDEMIPYYQPQYPTAAGNYSTLAIIIIIIWIYILTTKAIIKQSAQPFL